MKSIKALAALLCALPISSGVLAQSAEQAECDRIRYAADAGRNRAVERLNTIDNVMFQQVQQARTCMDRFGDAAARQTVTIGGFDVTPLRNALFEAGCNVMQGRLTAALPSPPPQLTSATQLLSRVPGLQSIGSASPVAMPPIVPSAPVGFSGQPVNMGAQPAPIPQLSSAVPIYGAPAGSVTNSGVAAQQSLWDRLSCTMMNRC